MTLQEAADRLGVHYQTAYRWVREGQLTAVKLGASYLVTDEEIDRFLAWRALPVAPPERVTVRNWDTQQARLYEALIAGDELEARTIVDRLGELHVPLVELCEQLLAPAVARVGAAWHEGHVSIAQEHRSTAIADRLLARISTNPRGRPRGTAVVVAAPGDRHFLPSTMAALSLRDDRWKVHHLGGDVPPRELIAFAESVHADLVVISLTFPPSVQSERKTDDELSFDELVHQLESQGRAVLVGAPGRTLSELVAAAREI